MSQIEIVSALESLIKRGLSQDGIANLIQQKGVTCSQVQIHYILKGSEPRYELGKAILDIKQELDRQEKKVRRLAKRVKKMKDIRRE